MKARIVNIVIAVSILFVAFGAAPARAGVKTTDYTGTWAFVDWVDQAPWKFAGGTIHDLANTYWNFDSTDPRLSGIYVLDTNCNWPKGAFIYGPCVTKWTVDVDGDQQPDWEGVLNLTSATAVWRGNGHGLGQFAGLNVTFSIVGFFPDGYTVSGQVIGN